MALLTGMEAEEAGDGMEDDESFYGLMQAAKRAKAGAAVPKAAAALLYGEEGQFNPHAARAERKKAKKGGPEREVAVTAAAAAKAAKGKGKKQAEEEDDEDFEFEEGSGDDGEEEGGEGEGEDGDEMSD